MYWTPTTTVYNNSNFDGATKRAVGVSLLFKRGTHVTPLAKPFFYHRPQNYVSTQHRF